MIASLTQGYAATAFTDRALLTVPAVSHPRL